MASNERDETRPIPLRCRRIAVTGQGVNAPGGTGVVDFWSTLRAGRSVAAPISSFDASGLPVSFACEASEFVTPDELQATEAGEIDRAVHLGIAAALDAVADAGASNLRPDRCGVAVGNGLGGLHTLLREYPASLQDVTTMSPIGAEMLMAGAASASLAGRLGWTGPNLTFTSACASSAHAIGEAARLIRDGAADVMVAGGTEAPIAPLLIGLFWRMGLLSERNDVPATACRPFDRSRDGFVLGEGAGFVVLEDWERAEARGAVIHAELVGYGRDSDAAHITSPSAGGVGAAECIELALADGNVQPCDVVHISAHGTGTALNDDREVEAIVKVFGPSPPPVTAPKSIFGHLLGASGAVEAVASILSIEHHEIPPTANFDRDRSALPLDIVAGQPRSRPSGVGLCNSFGFGGHNVTLLFRDVVPGHGHAV
jgi:3-oxoacyl-[acyl-carrier-protein] synthase II